MRKLCVLLTDSMNIFYEKGEIKEQYYNPDNFFNKVIMISFVDKDICNEAVACVVGKAVLRIISVGFLRFPSYFISIFKVFKVIKSEKPDVIRCYDSSVRGVIAVIIGRILKIPVVISLHCDLDEQRNYDKRRILILRKVFERFSISFANVIICVSKHVADYAKRYGANSPIVIYNGVNFKQFNFLNHKPIKGVLLSVGRLSSEKFQECLIRAIKDIDIDKLILIGSGPKEKKLKKIALENGVNDKVEFIRSVPYSQIHNYYSSADIFVLASHYEGFCIPIIEAMASGLPIVASNLPSIAEIIGEHGLLCDNNPRCFKRKIKLLLNNYELWSDLRERARERSNLFDFELLQKQEADVYKNLLPKKMI